jgi:hypothetical protein
MPCDANTLLQEAADSGLCGLDDRSIDLLIVAAMLPGAGYPTAATTMASGTCYNGYSTRQLEEMILAQFCLNLG